MLRDVLLLGRLVTRLLLGPKPLLVPADSVVDSPELLALGVALGLEPDPLDVQPLELRLQLVLFLQRPFVLLGQRRIALLEQIDLPFDLLDPERKIALLRVELLVPLLLIDLPQLVLGDLRVALGELRVRLGALRVQQIPLRLQLVDRAPEPVEAAPDDEEVRDLQLALELFVLSGARRLNLQAADLLLQLDDDVVEAHEVLARRIELLLGLFPLRLVLGDPGDLFEDEPAILGLGVDHPIDLPLLDDRVGAFSHARVHEKLVNVPEAARGLVDEKLAGAVTVDTPGDRDLFPLVEGGELRRKGDPRAIQDEAHLGHRGRGAVLGAGEDHVGHALAAQVARALLAHHPHDGVDDVALTATVRPDDTRHTRFKGENGAIEERLEAL